MYNAKNNNDSVAAIDMYKNMPPHHHAVPLVVIETSSSCCDAQKPNKTYTPMSTERPR